MPNTTIPIQSNEIDWFFVLECRQADSQPVFQDEQIAGYPACWIAGMQKSKIAGKRDSLLSKYPARLMDEMADGRNERPQSCLTRYWNGCRVAVRQGSSQ